MKTRISRSSTFTQSFIDRSRTEPGRSIPGRKEVNMWITDEFGNEYDVPTYCDICKCSDCPRCGDDCDGEREDDDERDR